jgi:twitching motility protein PilI
LLPLGQAGEIFPLANLQPVPYSKSWFRGVLNVRGSLLGVVALADFIAVHGGDSPKVTATAGAETSVITLNALLDVNCALQVDALSGLRGSDAFTASQPAQAGDPAYFGNRLCDTQGQYWQEINLRALAQSPQFLSISA